MEFVIIWLLFGIVAAVIASYRGRSGCGWFLLGVLIGPFSLVVALLPTTEEKLQQQAREQGAAPGYRKCPYCGEAIRQEAIKCRYCQSDVDSLAGKPMPEGRKTGSGRLPAGFRRCPECGRYQPQRFGQCICGHGFRD